MFNALNNDTDSRAIVAITNAGPVGRSLAVLLVQRGYRIAVFHFDNMQEHADSIVQELGEEHVYTAVVEFANLELWRDAMEGTKAYFGRYPHSAIINYDEWHGGSPLHVGGWDDKSVYDNTQAGNLEAVYRALRVFLPPMVEAKAGSVVITGPQIAEQPRMGAGAAAYTAAKAGCVALMQATAQEVSASGVRINAVLYSILDTPDSRAGLPGFDTSQWITTDSLAKVIGFLISDDARDVSGATLPVYGQRQ